MRLVTTSKDEINLIYRRCKTMTTNLPPNSIKALCVVPSIAIQTGQSQSIKCDAVK